MPPVGGLSLTWQLRIAVGPDGPVPCDEKNSKRSFEHRVPRTSTWDTLVTQMWPLMMGGCGNASAAGLAGRNPTYGAVRVRTCRPKLKEPAHAGSRLLQKSQLERRLETAWAV